MKLFLLIFTLLFSAVSPGFAQQDSSISFIAYWSVGDSYNFKITKLKKQWKEGKLYKNDSTQYISNFEVIDSTADSYKIKWKYKTNIASTYKIAEDLRQKFAKYENIDVIYTTNEYGTFQDIENWQEISEITTTMFKELIENIAETENKDKEALDKAMQPIVQIFSSKQGLEQLVFKELSYFHFPFGVEFNIYDPILYEENLPNMLGGDPIKGEAKVYFEEVDFENYTCIMKQEMKLNEADTKEIVMQLFKKMGIDNKELQKSMKNAKFNITDNNHYEYYYNPGVPIFIQTQRETIVNIGPENVKSVEETVIELVD